jgi:undecaprenyl phosphate-alpha-L-ara4N flippase subunit ArnE
VNALAIILCTVCQLFLVAGQLLLKRAMNATHDEPPPRGKIASNLAGGIALLSLWFFLWLGLLGQWELSHLFPFEGLNPALLMIGAWIFLRERVPPRGWVGIVLISAGIALVSGS